MIDEKTKKNPERSFLDNMDEKTRAEYEAKIKQREIREEKRLKITPENALVAEFGLYFGWQAVIDVGRGYSVSDGEKIPLTLERVQSLVEGVRVVKAREMLDLSAIAVIGHTYKHSSKNYGRAIKPFEERAKIDE